MSTAPNPEITVVYPVFDVRGALGTRLRTWTCEQTLPRERYRVIVGVNRDQPAQAREAQALLAPHDEIVAPPDANDGLLWNAGAARAGTRWLVFTEGHCLATPGCLDAVTRWIAANPNAEAGNFAVDHPDSYQMARLSRRWFDQMQAEWRSPQTWPRLHRAGFVIRADLFDAVGGFEPEYGQFAAPLLSARLHERGVRAGMVPGAAVIHMDDHSMNHHHYDTADFVRGECEARTRSDPDFFESYFGPDPAHLPQLQDRRAAWRMLQALLLTSLRGRRQARALAPLLRRYAMPALAGMGPRIALNRLAVKLDEVAVDHLPLPASWKWARFLRAHRRVVDLTRLEWAAGRAARPSPAKSFHHCRTDQVSPDMLVGLHGIERHQGRPFRWTEPVMLLRLSPSSEQRLLRLETTGTRDNPADAVIAVVANGQRLARGALASDGGALTLLLPPTPPKADRSEVVIICRPVVPSGPDIRRLGLPLLSVAIDPGMQWRRAS